MNAAGTTERPGNRVADTNESAKNATRADWLRAAQRLAQLVQGADAFLAEQFRQLDTLLAQAPAGATTDTAVQAERSALLQRQLAWERQRNEELQRIAQDREQLGEAWTRLEAEQRRLLAEEALWRAQATTKRENYVNRAHDLAGSDSAGGTRAPDSEVTYQPGPAASRESVSRESALVDYEKLRSDVQRHARRLRRGT